MPFDKINVFLQEMDQCRKKMCDEELLLAASAATVVFVSPALVQKLKKKKILDSSESARPQEIQCDRFYARLNFR